MIEWLPVREFAGYEVSNTGQVRGRRGPLKTRIDPKGYLFATFRTAGQNCKRSIARVVAQAFLGIRPEGCVVRHLDGNKANNTPSNLAYGTPTENEHDKRRHGTAPIGMRHPAAKLTDAQVIEIRGRYVPYHPIHGGGALGREFGVSQRAISLVVNNTNWQHLPPRNTTEAP